MKTEDQIMAEIDRLQDAIDNDAPYYDASAKIEALEWVIDDTMADEHLT